MKVFILSCAILTLILLIRYVLYFQNLKVYRVGDSFKREVTLLAEPKVSSFYQTFKVDSLTIETPTYPEFHYGDTLLIDGTIEDGSFQAKNGKTINRLIIKNPQITPRKTNLLITSSAFLRNKIKQTFNSNLPKNEAALLFGIVFGGTGGFDKNTQNAFVNSGVLHVVSASGMNVSLVAGFLIAVLNLVFKRKTALFFAVGGIFYYALLSGFSSSIVRASIMAGVAFSAGILGKQNHGVFALFLTVFIMLMFQPGIVFDVGFLLSFTATFGIIMIKPVFDSFKVMKKTKAFSDDVTTGISAQLGSIPVMVSVFGSYSLISIFVNLLVLWTIPVLMILGGAASICALTIPFVSVIFLYLSYPLLLYFEKVVTLFGKASTLQLDNTPIILWVGYYLVLAGVVMHLNKVKNQKSNLPAGKAGVKS